MNYNKLHQFPSKQYTQLTNKNKHGDKETKKQRNDEK